MWGLPAPFPATHDAYANVLILAFAETGALFVCDDGQLRFDDYTHLRVEWRFNWATHTWEDENLGDFYAENTDFTDTESEFSTSLGGEAVSGDIPEPDGTDRSDSPVEGIGAAGSLDAE